jgi:hypothetical protein
MVFERRRNGHYELNDSEEILVMDIRDTKKEKEVNEIVKNMCYPSKTYLRNMIASEQLINTGLTAMDVEKYYVDSVPIVRGKANNERTCRVNPKELVPNFCENTDVAV